jgi:hypothetical protein
MVEGSPENKKQKVMIIVTTEFLVDIPNTEITEKMGELRRMVIDKNIEILGADSKIERAVLKDMTVRMTY